MPTQNNCENDTNMFSKLIKLKNEYTYAIVNTQHTQIVYIYEQWMNLCLKQHFQKLKKICIAYCISCKFMHDKCLY